MSEFESLLSVFFLREKNLGKIIIIKIKQKGLKLCFFFVCAGLKAVWIWCSFGKMLL